MYNTVPCSLRNKHASSGLKERRENISRGSELGRLEIESLGKGDDQAVWGQNQEAW